MPYIHDDPDWPAFRWDAAALAVPLAATRHRQGRLLGRMEALGFPFQAQASLQVLTDDAVASSAIEGERLDRGQVRSSIARRLGMDVAGLVPAGRDVEGVVGMALDATGRSDVPLTAERLFDWHAGLFPTGRSGGVPITVGAWRTARSGPMRVVSGPVGRERMHFEAPDAARLDGEMRVFLAWFDAPPPGLDPVLRAGVAHLWFVTVHPFEDGNGRIARAVADMALARADGSARRFYSMSAQIEAERAAYYRALEGAQRGTPDITAWLLWFLACLDRALDRAAATLATTLATARFWDAHRGTPLNARQHHMLARLLDGFEGKLTSSKWARLAKCSQDTALRDIDDLLAKNMLRKEAAGGRSTSYILLLPP